MSEIVFSVSVPFNVMWPHSSAHNVFIVGEKSPEISVRSACSESLPRSRTQVNRETLSPFTTTFLLYHLSAATCLRVSSLHWFQFHACCCDFKVCYPAGWKLSCFFKLLSWWMICSLGYPPCGFPGQGLFWVLIGAKITNGHPQALPSWRLRFRE